MKRILKKNMGLSLLVFVMLVILVSLGVWQTRKIGPKTQYIASIESGLNAPSVALSELFDQQSQRVATGKDLAYRRVEVSGKFITTKSLRLFGTNLDGKSGYHLYSLFKSDDGHRFIASPGWVAFHDEVPDISTVSAVWSGVLVPPSDQASFTPDNDPNKNVWYYTDLPRMADALMDNRSVDVMPFRLILDSHKSMPMLEGGQVRVNIPNDHLEYAITWFSLAIVLIAIYILYVVSRRYN